MPSSFSAACSQVCAPAKTRTSRRARLLRPCQELIRPRSAIRAHQSSIATTSSLQTRMPQMLRSIVSLASPRCLNSQWATLSCCWRRGTWTIWTRGASSSMMRRSSSLASGASLRSLSSTERSQMLSIASKLAVLSLPASRT